MSGEADKVSAAARNDGRFPADPYQCAEDRSNSIYDPPTRHLIDLYLK